MGSEIIIDDFLDDYDSFRLECDNLDYSGMENPYDGVFYHGVTDKFSEDVKEEVVAKLQHLFSDEIKINALFLRKSSLGTPCPHPIHTDSSMGELSFMLYLNRPEHCLGGTGIMIHKETGLHTNPESEPQQAVWDADHKKPEKWQLSNMFEMKSNRGVLFGAGLMRAALPIGGFGGTNEDSRLVLTAFLEKA